MKPHSLFKVWRPDEVAECLDGVGFSPLYGKLWELVPLYKKAAEPVEEPMPGFNSLSKFWSKLSAEEKAELNKLAKEFDEKFGMAG